MKDRHGDGASRSAVDAFLSGGRGVRRGQQGGWLVALVLLASCGMGEPLNEGVAAGDVVVYERLDFDESPGGFRATRGATVELTEDAIQGRALKIEPRSGWAGAQLPLAIEGSSGLKLAFLARGAAFPEASLNVFDDASEDNTTSEAPRFLDGERWTPVLYSLDSFVYNSRRRVLVDAATSYRNLRFFGPERPAAGARMIVDDLVLYRGTDATPPSAVTELRARERDDGVELIWAPGRDNVGVMGYAVSRRRAGEGGFSKVAEVHRPRWLDPAAGPEAVEYRVLAFDFERSLGPWSDPVRAAARGGRPSVTVARTASGSGPPIDAAALREVHSRGAGRVRKGRVCLFGDSLTHARVYRRMGEAALGIYTVSAQGFEGHRTDHGRRRIDEILDLENPEFLLVLLGTNNLRDGTVPGQGRLAGWMSDFEALAAAAHARGTVVLFGTVPPRGFDDPASRPEAAFNEALHRLASSIGVPVAPIFERLQAGEERRAYLAEDGVHWEPAAMKEAARAWADTLRRVEWALRDR